MALTAPFALLVTTVALLGLGQTATSVSPEECTTIAEFQLDSVLATKYQGYSCPRLRALGRLRRWCNRASPFCQGRTKLRCEKAAARKSSTIMKRLDRRWPCVPLVQPLPEGKVTQSASAQPVCKFRVDFHVMEGHSDWTIGLSTNLTSITAAECIDGCFKSVEYELPAGEKYEFVSRDIDNARVFPDSELRGGYMLFLNDQMFASGEVDAAEFVSFAIEANACTVMPPVESPFSIHMVYDDSVPMSFHPVFDQAILRWTSAVKSSASIKEFEWNGKRYLANDVVVYAQFVKIDGPDNVLAIAKPGGFRSPLEGARPYFGMIQIDSDDVDLLNTVGVSAEHALRNIITHEIGHVLGLGSLWNGFRDDLTDGSTYIGHNAVEQYKSYGGPADVTGFPLETDGGSGTAGGHWDEASFDKELMTGFVDDGTNALSRISIGFLADIGYSVDYSAAEDFTLSDANHDVVQDVMAKMNEGYRLVGNTLVKPTKNTQILPLKSEEDIKQTLKAKSADLVL